LERKTKLSKRDFWSIFQKKLFGFFLKKAIKQFFEDQDLTRISFSQHEQQERE